MSYVYKCNAQRFMHFFQFHLHILAHFEVERSQRFVEQQHFRLIDNGTGNSDTLLLATGKRIYIPILVIRHTNHLQCGFHLLADCLFRRLFQLQAESNIVVYIQMREQGIFLKYRVHRTFMGWSLCDFLTRYSDFAFRSCLKTGNETQQCCFSAAGRSENRNKLALFHVQSYIIQSCFVAKKLRYMANLNDGFVFLHIHTKSLGCKGTHFYDFHLRVNLI